MYKSNYKQKFEAIDTEESAVTNGLEKLAIAGEDIRKLKEQIATKSAELAIETAKLDEVKKEIAIKAEGATIVKENAARETAAAEEIQTNVIRDKAVVDEEMAAAIPIINDAKSALSKIKKNDVGEVAKMGSPFPILLLCFDCAAIIMGHPVKDFKWCKLSLGKEDVWAVEDSWALTQIKVKKVADYCKELLCLDTGDDQYTSEEFMNQVTDEVVELLWPYANTKNFNEKVAGGASGAGVGLCLFVGAAINYRKITKKVAPLKMAVKEKDIQLANAMISLDRSSKELAAANLEMSTMEALRKKKNDEADAMNKELMAIKRKGQKAENLIGSLSGEKVRWEALKAGFITKKKQLMGDVGCSCAFVS